MEPTYAIMVLSLSGSVFDGHWWRKVFTPTTWIAGLSMEDAILEMAKLEPALTRESPCQWIAPYDEHRWRVPPQIVRQMTSRGHLVKVI